MWNYYQVNANSPIYIVAEIATVSRKLYTVVFRGISNFCKVAKHLWITVYMNIFWLWHRPLTRSKSCFLCTQTLSRYLLSRLPTNQQSRENVWNRYIISSRAVANTPVLNWIWCRPDAALHFTLNWWYVNRLMKSDLKIFIISTSYGGHQEIINYCKRGRAECGITNVV